MLRTYRSTSSISRGVFLFSLADILATGGGIFILVIISQLLSTHVPKTFVTEVQEDSGTATFEHRGEIEYNGQQTLPVIIRRRYFEVPKLNHQYGEIRKYEYERIDTYPELKNVFKEYIGKGSKKVTHIRLEPAPNRYLLQKFLQNPRFNAVFVDTTTPDCKFALDEKTKKFFCAKGE